MMRLTRSLLITSLLMSAATMMGCKPAAPSAPPRTWDMLAGAQAALWQSAEIPGGGAAAVRDGEATLAEGGPLTGLRFTGWQAGGLPVRDYEITCEAMRMAGQDFFAAITFPVRDIATCGTLIVGGWGGGLVGISSIDGQDASDNLTRNEQRFENGQWYRIRLEVRDELLRCWIDERLVFNASIKARAIGMRAGYIENCAPFGLATYGTQGRVRALVVRQLRGAR
jgi:hypothetical protein